MVGEHVTAPHQRGLDPEWFHWQWCPKAGKRRFWPRECQLLLDILPLAWLQTRHRSLRPAGSVIHIQLRRPSSDLSQTLVRRSGDDSYVDSCFIIAWRLREHSTACRKHLHFSESRNLLVHSKSSSPPDVVSSRLAHSYINDSNHIVTRDTLSTSYPQPWSMIHVDWPRCTCPWKYYQGSGKSQRLLLLLNQSDFQWSTSQPRASNVSNHFAACP